MRLDVTSGWFGPFNDGCNQRWWKAQTSRRLWFQMSVWMLRDGLIIGLRTAAPSIHGRAVPARIWCLHFQFYSKCMNVGERREQIARLSSVSCRSVVVLNACLVLQGRPISTTRSYVPCILIYLHRNKEYMFKYNIFAITMRSYKCTQIV
jgi:hypothetical protein